MKVVFTGGGSESDIFPLIALTREFRRLSPHDLELYYLGPKDIWARSYLSQEQIIIRGILTGKRWRPFSLFNFVLNIFDLAKTVLGFCQALFNLLYLNPDLVLAKGGLVSVPAVSAAKILGIPIFLHESNVVPRREDSWIGKRSLEIFTSFPEAEGVSQDKAIHVGHPISQELLAGSFEGAGKTLEIIGDKPAVFILSGSKNMEKINDLLLLLLPQLLEEFEVIHQCGFNDYERVYRESKVVIRPEAARYYHLYPFLRENEAKEAYFIAKVIIGRPTAGNIFTIAALAKPSILIPSTKSGQEYQIKNGYYFAYYGACLVIEEANLTPQFFLQRLRYMAANESELEKLGRSAKVFAKPLAAKVMAHYLIEYLRK